jgi:hypothetical protein
MKSDPFEIENLRIDPKDPRLKPRSSTAPPAKKKWQRKWVRVPWVWVERLRASDSPSTYRLALFLLYEHWRTGGRAIRLSNVMLKPERISRRAKGPALQELEHFGLVTVERRPRKSPRITLLLDPRADR